MHPFAITKLLGLSALACDENQTGSALGRWSLLLVVASQLGAALTFTIEPAISQERRTAPSSGIAASEATDTLTRLHEHIRNSAVLNFEVGITVSSSVSGGRTQATAAFLVRKPNMFRVEVAVKGRSYVILSDGTLVTLSRPTNNTFAQYPTSASLLGTMYTVAGLTNLSGRMLDFFWAVNSGLDTKVSAIPSLQVGGRQCAGIRVVRFEETFDVWVETKGDPLPCRLQSRRTDGSAVSVNTYIFKWIPTSNIAADAFGFMPSKGSRQVNALEVR